LGFLALVLNNRWGVLRTNISQNTYMSEAFKEGKKESEFWKDAKTIAAGIRVPKAFADFLILRALYESGGGAVAVSDREILEASKELAREGVFACPEGAATLAGLKQLLEEGNIDRDEKILLYNTGSGIKYTEVYSKNLNWSYHLLPPLMT